MKTNNLYGIVRKVTFFLKILYPLFNFLIVLLIKKKLMIIGIKI